MIQKSKSTSTQLLELEEHIPTKSRRKIIQNPSNPSSREGDWLLYL